MTSATMASDESSLSSFEISKIWLRHLTSLLFPLSTLAFLWTGPHPWYVAPLFAVPIGVAFYLDNLQRDELREPIEKLPAWPFDLLVYSLAGLQFVIVYQLGVMFSSQAIFSVDMAMVFLVVGSNSGFSIITAHELIHRRNPADQLLGRLLLCTVLYEHFYTEHLRGHHVRVGKDEDPATARYGETFREFWRRTVPAQFKSAWRLEAQRLGDADMPLADPRMLRNRILHGIAVGWGMAAAIYLGFGLTAFVAFLLQAFMAVRLLEAVNYFEHWGLRRNALRVRPMDSWDTHSWFTYYGLTGLSRHADHHAYPTRPYQQLRTWEEAPLLPTGYIGTIDMVLVHNDEFRRLAMAELERRRLGPFAEDADPAESQAALAAAAAAPPPTPLQDRVGALLRPLSTVQRHLLLASAFVVAVSAGALLERGSMAGLGALVAQNAWIIAVFAGFFALQRMIQDRTENGTLSWGAAFAMLVTVGKLSAPYLGA